MPVEELKKKYDDMNINLVDVGIISKLFQDTDAMYHYIYKNQEWELFNYTSYVNIYYPCLILRKMYQLKKNKPYLYLNYHSDYNYMKQEHSLLFRSYLNNLMNIYNKEENTITTTTIKKNSDSKRDNKKQDDNMLETIDTYSVYYQYQISKKEKRDKIMCKDKTIKSIFRIMDKIDKLL